MRPILLGVLIVAALAGAAACGPMPVAQVVAPAVVDKEGKPLTAPELIAQADSLRDGAIVALANGAIMGVDADLAAAGERYARALRLSPDSYEANLGLGVTYATRARLLQGDDTRKDSYLTVARRALGRAYMVRQGPFEPLYYLAEIAVLDKDYSKAQEFLKPLEDAGAKPGPVAALLGYIAERQGRKDEAQSYYIKALEAGGPIETLVYITPKIKRRK